jgi:dihydroorotate dehydrogenase electron transfer subunit
MLGKMTSRLAGFGPGQKLEIWGPLGNGFPPEPVEHLIMVGGGIGQTPFMALSKESLGLQRYGDPPRAAPQAQRVTLCYGARRREYLAGVDDFERLGVEVQISTDDGSAGHHGFVTDLLRRALDAPVSAASTRGLSQDSAGARIVACGPMPMMKAVAGIAATAEIPCQVSLETPMACGIGICFSCVAKIRDPLGGEWDYRRTCVEGPVFDAARIVWD